MELRAQVKRFVELTGHLPNHMDGHQHVHVLPGEPVMVTSWFHPLTDPNKGFYEI